ncbi:MAG: Ig-like domain-containing protein [bacterium]
MMKIKTMLFFIVCLAALSQMSALAQEMSSPSFRIAAQVLDGGGSQSSSAQFTLIGALGQPTAIGSSQSTSFIDKAGFIPVIACFAANTTYYTLGLTKAGTGTGTITSSPSGIDCGADCTEGYAQGTVVTLSAAAAAGSTFTGWSGGGCSGTADCILTMNEDTDVTAAFTLQTYTIEASAGSNGSISPSGIVTVDHGSDQLFTITPNPDYQVADVLVDGGLSVGAVTTYTFTNITDNHTIEALFCPSSPAQNCQDCHGSVTGSPSHATHIGADPKGTSMSCTDCHTEGKLVDPCPPCTGMFADGESLAQTAVCDACHSPGGIFDGVDDPVIGAKANWPGGVYQQPAGLGPGLENWCAGCHDNGSSVCYGVSAPNVMGNNATYGYNITGHKITCAACHDPAKAHVDGQSRTYSHDSDPFNPDDQNNYQNGYRLVNSMTIPLGAGPLGGSSQARFALCFTCHDYDQLMDDTAPFATNFQDDGINRHRSHLLSGRYAWDSDWDYLLVPDEIIVDNPQAGFAGDWPSSTAVGGYYGTDYQWHAAADGTSSVTWTPLLPQSRDYKVYARWTADTDRASNAAYAIAYDGGTFIATVDQRTDGGNWTLLGTFIFIEGISGYVQLTDLADGVVVADAVKFGDPLIDSRISCPACHNVHGSPNPAMIRHGELISTPGASDKVPALNFRWYKADGYTPTIFGEESAYGDMPVLGGPGGGALEESMVCVACHGGSSLIKYDRTYQALGVPTGSWARPSLPPSVRLLNPQPQSREIAVDRTLSFLLLSNGQDALDWTTFTISLQGDISYSQTYTDEDTGVVSVTGTSACYQVTIDPVFDFSDQEQITVTVSIQDTAGHSLTSPAWAFTTGGSSPVIWRTPQAVHSEDLFWQPECLIDDHPETGNKYTPFAGHWVIFDLGQSYEVTQIRLLLSSDYSGRSWNIFVSDDPDDFGTAVKTGWLAQPDPAGTSTAITPKQGRYLKLSTAMGPVSPNTLLEVDFATGN